MLRLVVAAHIRLMEARVRLRGMRRPDEGGQATAEYALVLLGVAAIALLVAAWATKSGKIGQLFDAVIGKLISKAR